MVEKRKRFGKLQEKLRAVTGITTESTRPDTSASRERPNDADLIKSYFYNSFRLSQGNPSTQDHIFGWLASHGYLENIDIPRKLPPYIIKMPIPTRHEDLNRLGPLNDIRLMYIHFIDSKDIKSPTTEVKGIGMVPFEELIVKETIERDFIYQHKKRPGRDAATDVKPDSVNDPHASFLRKYVINGETMGGIAAYDDLLAHMQQSLVASIAEQKFSPDIQGCFDELVERWEINHPGISFFPLDFVNKIERFKLAQSEPEVGKSTQTSILEQEAGAVVFDSQSKRGKTK